MEIIIRSRENGWETERRMELPEDDGLVKSILRSVKRRVNPPQKAGGGLKSRRKSGRRELRRRRTRPRTRRRQLRSGRFLRLGTKVSSFSPVQNVGGPTP